MSDISQHGLICTLQRLHENPGLNEALERLTQERPVALILPCHAGELGRPALPAILEKLAPATFISEVLIPINGVDADGFSRAKSFFHDGLSRPHRLIRGDEPHPVPGFRPGKGANVWLAAGLLAQEKRVSYVLCADADVTTFRLEMLARLAFSLADPDLGYVFAKSYYPRVVGEVDGRIYGRVSRLFLAPLLQALVRTCGHLPLLDFLRSFRYPLAGECGMTLDLAASLPFESGWGLEIGMLCDTFRQVDPRRVCQVDAGGGYDHKHQPLGDAESGLGGMAGEIARTLFAHLAREGMRLDAALFESLTESYRREAAEALRRSAALAKINALRFEGAEESQAVALFQTTLREAFQKPPATALPAWRGEIVSNRKV